MCVLTLYVLAILKWLLLTYESRLVSVMKYDLLFIESAIILQILLNNGEKHGEMFHVNDS